MINRADLMPWIVDALKESGGTASIADICRYIWENYEDELRRSGNLFYTCQYDVRWAGMKLRKDGILTAAEDRKQQPWTLRQERS